MSKQKYADFQLLIDIGGSNIKLYKYKRGAWLELIDFFPTPTSSILLTERIFQSIELCSTSLASIGIPGPVYGGESSIYMPPLKYELDLSEIKRRMAKLGITYIIENDCSLLHTIAKFLPSTRLYNSANSNEANCGSICISLGTSFGINGITAGGGSISLEMAHLPLKSLCCFITDTATTCAVAELPLTTNISSILNSRSILSLIVKDSMEFPGDSLPEHKAFRHTLSDCSCFKNGCSVAGD